MMLSVQNNFGYHLPAVPQLPCIVAFPNANVAGHGLIAVGCSMFSGLAPNNIALTDSQKNAWLLIGGIGRQNLSSGETLLLYGWYVQSCKAGANTVTLVETGQASYLALGIFEYPGAFGALDAGTSVSGLAQVQMNMNVMTAAVDLLFAFGATFVGGPLSVDSGSTGWTQEQSESGENASGTTILWYLAVDQAANPGPQTLALDIAAPSSVNVALLAALPALWSPPPSPTPTPAPTGPGARSALPWPTIF